MGGQEPRGEIILSPDADPMRGDGKGPGMRVVSWNLDFAYGFKETHE